jgi:hypothetical protein
MQHILIIATTVFLSLTNNENGGSKSNDTKNNTATTTTVTATVHHKSKVLRPRRNTEATDVLATQGKDAVEVKNADGTTTVYEPIFEQKKLKLTKQEQDMVETETNQ